MLNFYFKIIILQAYEVKKKCHKFDKLEKERTEFAYFQRKIPSKYPINYLQIAKYLKIICFWIKGKLLTSKIILINKCIGRLRILEQQIAKTYNFLRIFSTKILYKS